MRRDILRTNTSGGRTKRRATHPPSSANRNTVYSMSSATSSPVRLALVVLAGLATVTASAQPADPSAFSFLRIEPSARAAALGGSFAAIADGDINAFFYNPALITSVVDGSLSLSYLNHVSDINAGFVSYGYQRGNVATFAAGIRYLNWGTVEGADENGEPTGTFGAGDVALTVGAARPATDRVRYGANIHFIHSAVARFNASALAADFGVVYHDAERRVVVGVSVNNLGVSLSSLGEQRDDLPIDVRVAVSTRFSHLPLLVSLTGYNLHDLDPAFDDATVLDNILYHVAAGGEFQFSPAFNIRFGYNHRRHDELRSKPRLDFAGVSLGVGIQVRRFKFDYSHSSWSELGGLNQLTVGTTL